MGMLLCTLSRPHSPNYQREGREQLYTTFGGGEDSLNKRKSSATVDIQTAAMQTQKGREREREREREIEREMESRRERDI